MQKLSICSVFISVVTLFVCSVLLHTRFTHGLGNEWKKNHVFAHILLFIEKSNVESKMKMKKKTHKKKNASTEFVAKMFARICSLFCWA